MTTFETAAINYPSNRQRVRVYGGLSVFLLVFVVAIGVPVYYMAVPLEKSAVRAYVVTTIEPQEGTVPTLVGLLADNVYSRPVRKRTLRSIGISEARLVQARIGDVWYCWDQWRTYENGIRAEKSFQCRLLKP